MELRRAQQEWAKTGVRERLRIVRRVRGLIAERSLELTGAVRRDAGETLVAEVLPLAEACRFLECEAEELLAPKRPERSRPIWLSGVDLEIRREPLGVILVIGPANYPLFLPAVHSLQALVAGNAVLCKPGVDGALAMEAIARILSDAGLPAGLLRVLDEAPEQAQHAIAAGVDKVILTGSNSTGQAVMASLAPHVTPSVMELSGCDAVFVRADADLDLVVKALRFALRLNSGNTCIAPQKVYVARTRAAELSTKAAALRIPITAVDSDEESVELAASCGYALGASVFGDIEGARQLATRIRAGVVVINDIIVPTADPRLPFGGRGKSGFGVTRGAEGLLEMTVIKAVTVRRGNWRPHFDPSHPADRDLFRGLISSLHGSSLRQRFQGFVQMSRAAMARRKLN